MPEGTASGEGARASVEEERELVEEARASAAAGEGGWSPYATGTSETPCRCTTPEAYLVTSVIISEPDLAQRAVRVRGRCQIMALKVIDGP